MSGKKFLISLFERLRSVWRKFKSGVAWLDEQLEKLCRTVKQKALRCPYISTSIAILVFVVVIYRINLDENGTTFDRLAIAAGVIALVLAGWRSRVATRQEENTRNQIENTKKQIENTKEQIKIAVKGQLADRFAEAVELTSNNNLSIRLGGLATLKSLAEENFDERKRVFTYLCSFLRHPPDLKGWANDLREGTAQRIGDQQITFGKRPDIDAVCLMIRERIIGNVTLHLSLSRACLRGANLSMAYLRETNLMQADLREASLQKTWLQEAWLVGAHLQAADLQRSYLLEADLQGADLQGAVLQGAKFSNALFGSLDADRGQDLTAFRNLEQLKDTYYDEDSPEPVLHKSLPQELGDKTSRMRETYLQPISREEWIKKYSPKTRP